MKIERSVMMVLLVVFKAQHNFLMEFAVQTTNVSTMKCLICIFLTILYGSVIRSCKNTTKPQNNSLACTAIPGRKWALYKANCVDLTSNYHSELVAATPAI